MIANAVIEGKQGESFEPVAENEMVEEVENEEPTSIEEVVAEAEEQAEE